MNFFYRKFVIHFRQRSSSIRRKEFIRKRENSLARVLIGIVATFLACHILRIVLSIHEAITIRHAMFCDRNNKEAFPAWAHIVRSFSDLFLVINVSTNSIVYFLLNSTFRKRLFKGGKPSFSSSLRC